MIENQWLGKASYMSKVEELEETISNLHNTIAYLKFIANNISSEDVELQDASLKRKCRQLCKSHEWNDIVLGQNRHQLSILVKY